MRRLTAKNNRTEELRGSRERRGGEGEKKALSYPGLSASQTAAPSDERGENLGEAGARCQWEGSSLPVALREQGEDGDPMKRRNK